ncbi:hypothetical protein GCM10010967_13660 [Dyadobacter beijingensis]|uniref:Transposase/invertase (TIGR01784 family) n=1 Tax=Dyadobacter beijingensis TaxID=365489 RepID=A0ABQ2HK11_9BACT|nr:Rpn family recombination-promoting nuclease/putative transposase [Dyadobacter beijingensis]GGM83221.1 hypothetical protein GCM10010967_13660 [Dyadobacter beijingensis]
MLAAPYARFIDPLSDFGFKRLFGTEANKDLLIDFLNELLAGERTIRDLTYNQNESAGQRPVDRKAIFDLCCTGADGEQFIIEVQRVKQKFFKDRCLYYAASLIRDQVKTGEPDWGYELKPVYLIGLMEFTFEGARPNEYIHHIRLTSKEESTVFYDKFGFTFIEIPAFSKTESELVTGLDRWLYLLKNLSNLNHVPTVLSKPVFDKVLRIAEVCNFNQQEKMAWDAYLKAKWDNENSMKYVKEEAWETGLKEGREAGLEKGREEGRREEKLVVARSMKAKGFELQTIIEILGLTREEIEQA